jgi:hypothetical protein
MRKENANPRPVPCGKTPFQKQTQKTKWKTKQASIQTNKNRTGQNRSRKLDINWRSNTKKYKFKWETNHLRK